MRKVCVHACYVSCGLPHARPMQSSGFQTRSKHDFEIVLKIDSSRIASGYLCTSGKPFWAPLGSPWIPSGSIGQLLGSPWTLFGPRTKKETKSEMEDPCPGVQVGPRNPHFSCKSDNEREKMNSQTGSEKRSCLEGVTTF